MPSKSTYPAGSTYCHNLTNCVSNTMYMFASLAWKHDKKHTRDVPKEHTRALSTTTLNKKYYTRV